MARPPGIGSAAPDFTLPGWYDGEERSFTLSAERGNPVVLAFYPGDDTPVCTRQLCSYSDHISDLTGLGAVVWGISTQDIASHRAFATKRGLRLPLLADVDHTVGKAYGVDRAMMTKRSVFVIDAAGRIAWSHVSALGLYYRSVDEIADVLSRLPVA